MSDARYQYETLDEALKNYGSKHTRAVEDGLIMGYHCDYSGKRYGGNTLLQFDMMISKLNKEDDNWVGFCLRGLTPEVMNGTMYEILFHPDYIVLSRYVNDEKTYFFGYPKNEKSGSNARFGFLPNKYVFPRVRHSIVAGAVDEEEGVRILLYVDGQPVFDVLDTDQPIREPGYFIVQAASQPIYILNYTAIDRRAGRISLELPRGKFFPYPELVRQYLCDETGSEHIIDYIGGSHLKPLTVSWKSTREDITGYTLSYGRKKDYSDAVTLEFPGEVSSYDIYNLYKGAAYYCKVTATTSTGEILTEEGKFETTDQGPRVIRAEGADNIRDLGGYKTLSGKKIAQGMVFRSASLGTKTLVEDKTEGPILTPAGERVLSEELGIRTELELRADKETGDYTESMIPGAKLFRCPIGFYEEALAENRKELGEIFKAFSHRDFYPVCFHCAAGADRTGLLGYLLGGLLGMSGRELDQDYEFTTFSTSGLRGFHEGLSATFATYMKESIDRNPGDTLADRIENYLIDCGVTKEEIASIREILLED